MRAAFEDGDQLPVVGDGDHVKVFTRWPGMDPWPTAERYCEALGRKAWLREANNGRSLYDCLTDAPGAKSPSPEPAGAARSAPSPRETQGALP